MPLGFGPTAKSNVSEGDIVQRRRDRGRLSVHDFLVDSQVSILIGEGHRWIAFVQAHQPHDLQRQRDRKVFRSQRLFENFEVPPQDDQRFLVLVLYLIYQPQGVQALPDDWVIFWQDPFQRCNTAIT